MSSPVDGELKTGSSSSNSAPRQRCVCVESLRPIASAARERLGTSSVVCRVCVVVYEESAADLSSVYLAKRAIPAVG